MPYDQVTAELRSLAKKLDADLRKRDRTDSGQQTDQAGPNGRGFPQLAWAFPNRN